MAKFDMNAALRYGVLGAGALAVPKVVAMVPQIGDMLAKIPMVGDPLWEGISILGIALAGVGIGVIDKLVYNK